MAVVLPDPDFMLAGIFLPAVSHIDGITRSSGLLQRKSEVAPGPVDCPIVGVTPIQGDIVATALGISLIC
jgi:hypothetical protein